MTHSFTAGPWAVEKISATEVEVVQDETDMTICRMGWASTDYARLRQFNNAKLISALPDFVAAVEAYLTGDGSVDCRPLMYAAMEKAGLTVVFVGNVSTLKSE